MSGCRKSKIKKKETQGLCDCLGARAKAASNCVANNYIYDYINNKLARIRVSLDEFDPSSERTLAVAITHASRMVLKSHGGQVSTTREHALWRGIVPGNWK